MNGRKILILFSLLISICRLDLAFADSTPLKVTKYQGNFPPYFFQKDGKEVGIMIDLTARLSDLTGYQFEFVNQPASRALYMFDMGKLDIEMNINPVWRAHLKEPGLYTIPYDQSTEVVLFSPGSKIPVNGPKDLTGKHVGTVFGYTYPSYTELFNRKKVYRHDFLNEQKLLEILTRGGRIKQVFMNKYAAMYWKKTVPAYQGLEIGDTISELDVMIRIHPSKKFILPKMNKALKYMLIKGEIEQIHSRYR